MTLYTQTLSPTGIISCKGADAGKFLQGQITSNIDEISLSNGVFGAFCNPKGRIKTTFLALQVAEEEFLLVMDSSQCDYIISELSPYIAFFKAELTSVTETYQVIGVISDAESQPTEIPLYTVLESDGIFEISMSGLKNRALKLVPRGLDSEYQFDNSLNWDLLDIEDGYVWINESNRESFLPHDINLPALGGVSYEKGCYTGQEIIARMHYRGNPKYTAAVIESLETDFSSTDQLLQQVDEDDSKKIGQVVSKPVSENGKSTILASVSKDLLDGSHFQLSNQPNPSILCNIKKPFFG